MDSLIQFFCIAKNFVISLCEKIKRYLFGVNKIYSMNNSKIFDLYYEYITMCISYDDYSYNKIFVEYDGSNRFFRVITKNKNLPEIKVILNEIENKNSYNKIIFGSSNDILINKIMIRDLNLISIFSNYVPYDYVPTVKDILDVNEIKYTDDTKISIDYIKDLSNTNTILNINNLINLGIDEIEKIL
jgi:hypothetical protein